MPRTARIAPPGYVYHVLARGNNRETIFETERDYGTYLHVLGKYKERYRFLLYHYVLMPNHVHLVVRPLSEGGTLAETMRGINLSYALYFKKNVEHVGHFWQDRFRSIIVSDDRYLLACGSYIELNPVRAGLVPDPEQYQWSSYRFHAYGEPNRLLDPLPISCFVQRQQAGTQQEYREFVRGMLAGKRRMKGEMTELLVYGDASFQEAVSKKLGQVARKNKRGRPRKEGK